MPGNDDKTRGVLRFIFNVRCDQLELVNGGGGTATDRRGSGIARRHARGFGVTHYRHALRHRKVLVQPLMTLREALTMRINLFDRSGFAAAAHHALVHGQQDFTAHLQWGSQ